MEDIPEQNLSFEFYYIDLGFYCYPTGNNFYLIIGPSVMIGDARITGPLGTAG